MFNWLKGIFGGECSCDHCGHCCGNEEKKSASATDVKPEVGQKENIDKV